MKTLQITKIQQTTKIPNFSNPKTPKKPIEKQPENLTKIPPIGHKK